MKSLIFLVILAFATALPSFYDQHLDIKVDDGQITIKNGQDKKMLITQPTDKEVKVVMTKEDGITTLINIKQDNITDNHQFATLAVLCRLYEGNINFVKYQQLLTKLREAVLHKKIHRYIYETLKNFDSDIEEAYSTPDNEFGQSQTPKPMGVYGEQSPIYGQQSPMYGQQYPMFGQQYPMYNHQTFNWNQLSQQYGSNFENQWPKPLYDSNYANNLEYHYQYSQEMYQTVKQTVELLKQMEQLITSHGQQDSQIQPRLQQIQLLYTIVEQNFASIQQCKNNLHCVNNFGKNWYALHDQQKNEQQNVYGQYPNGQNGYSQPTSQGVYGQSQGLYGQQPANAQFIYGQQISLTVQNQMTIDQVRAQRWQLIQKSQPLLQQLKMVNQELLQLITLINQQQQQLDVNAHSPSSMQQLQAVYYKLDAIVSQELQIQQQIQQCHQQMTYFARQMFPNHLSGQQYASNGQMQQSWAPQQSPLFTIQPQQSLLFSLQPQQQQQTQIPQQPQLQIPQQPQLQIPQQQPMQIPQPLQQQQMPVMQNNMKMMRNNAQWPVSG